MFLPTMRQLAVGRHVFLFDPGVFMSKALLSVMSATFVAAFVFAISPAHADDDRDYYQ